MSASIVCDTEKAKKFASVLNTLSDSDIDLLMTVFNKYLPDEPENVDEKVIERVVNALVIVLPMDPREAIINLFTVHPLCLKGLVDDEKVYAIKRIVANKMFSIKKIVDVLFDLDKRVEDIDVSKIEVNGNVMAKVLITTVSKKRIELLLDKDDFGKLCEGYERVFVGE